MEQFSKMIQRYKNFMNLGTNNFFKHELPVYFLSYVYFDEKINIYSSEGISN